MNKLPLLLLQGNGKIVVLHSSTSFLHYMSAFATLVDVVAVNQKHRKRTTERRFHHGQAGWMAVGSTIINEKSSQVGRLVVLN